MWLEKGLKEMRDIWEMHATKPIRTTYKQFVKMMCKVTCLYGPYYIEQCPRFLIDTISFCVH